MTPHVQHQLVLSQVPGVSGCRRGLGTGWETGLLTPGGFPARGRNLQGAESELLSLHSGSSQSLSSEGNSLHLEVHLPLLLRGVTQFSVALKAMWVKESSFLYMAGKEPNPRPASWLTAPVFPDLQAPETSRLDIGCRACVSLASAMENLASSATAPSCPRPHPSALTPPPSESCL